MKRGLLVTFTFLAMAPFFTMAQEMPERIDNHLKLDGARPDIPGILGFDVGFTLVTDFPDDMTLKFWGTNYFSGYYKYTHNVNDVISINAGVSLSTEKYKFSRGITIRPGEGYLGNYQAQIVGLDTLLDVQSITNSKLATTYVEIPLEFTFRTNPNPKRAFKFTVGGKAGYLLDSKTKIKYKQSGESKMLKDKQQYGLNSWRFNVIGRVEYGDIGLFYQYSITDLFEKSKGPEGTQGHPMNFGISLHLF